MRALAIDFGFKKIGVAVGETEFGVAAARPPLAASGGLLKDARAIADLAKREEAEIVVLGLPLEESGNEGRMARISRTLGAHLQALGVTVHWVDESYTSLEAAGRLADSVTRSVLGQPGTKSRQQRPDLKEKIHGEAAVLILERFQG